MHRPFAERRFRRGAIDRLVAGAGFAIGAIALLGVVALARASLPAVDGRDPAAARDLVRLMRAGEHGRWIVTSDFTRTLADGRVLRMRVREGRSGGLHVLVSGTSITIDQRDQAYLCSVGGDRSGCKQSRTGAALPASEVLRVAIALGAYDVVRSRDATIAGRSARCFRARATGRGGLPDLGVETDRCFDAGGIPLEVTVIRAPGTIDRDVATRVRRGVSEAAVESLAEAYASKAPSARR